MTPWLSLQITTRVDGSDFMLQAEVSSAQGIPTEVFVHNVADSLFSHVASVEDMLQLPISRDLAVTQQRPRYRLPSMTGRFQQISKLESFEAYLLTATKTLAVSWGQSPEPWAPSVMTHIIDGETTT